MAATQASKVQVINNGIKTPRIVLGVNENGEEVYIYYDPELERVVIVGALGLMYQNGNKLYNLPVTSPSLQS